MMAAGNYRRDVAVLDCPEWEDLVWMWSCGLSLLSASLQRFIIYPPAAVLGQAVSGSVPDQASISISGYTKRGTKLRWEKVDD